MRDEEEIRRKKKRRGSKRKRQKRKIIFTILAFILLLILIAFAFVSSKLGKMDKISMKDVKVNEGLDVSGMKGYTTLALFGVDNRTNGNFETGNSDTMIIVSINNDTGEIKMCSLYRDTYLDIGDSEGTESKFRKANAAYMSGGPEQAINMMNKNLDLNISDYVAVDFQALIDVIDLLGGVEIDVEAEEVQYINGYMTELNQITGKEIVQVSGAGTQTLNGMQATAYARIRYTTGWDFKRTERQRTVITKMFEKAKGASLGTLNSILDKALPEVSTSLSTTEMIGLMTKMGKYNMGENTGFPFDKTSGSVGSLGDLVIPVDLSANVKQLHEFLYNDTEYTPSPTVQSLSGTIRSNTGV